MVRGVGTMVTPNVRLVRLLGRGGMGSVWVADHLTLDTQVAVKFIAADALGTGGGTQLARFEREAKAVAKLRSPHVVQILDYGVMEEGSPYIVMELLEGESLGTRIKRELSLPLGFAVEVVTQVAKALSAAHHVGIVHRDVKPDNIFLTTTADGELHVKVLDFGVAKQTGLGADQDVTSTGSIVGSPKYMSPEQLLTTRDVDHQADLWALAVVTYRIITGIAPFRGETIAALSLAICHGEYRPPTVRRPDLPDTLNAFFARAFAEKPTERYASAKELTRGLREALAGVQGIEAPRDSSDSFSGTSWGSALGDLPSDLSERSPLVLPEAPALTSALGPAFSPAPRLDAGPPEGAADQDPSASLSHSESGTAGTRPAVLPPPDSASSPTGAAVPLDEARTLSLLTSSSNDAEAAASLEPLPDAVGRRRWSRGAFLFVGVGALACGAALAFWWFGSASGETSAAATAASAPVVATSTTSSSELSAPPPAPPPPEGMVAIAADKYFIGCDQDESKGCFDDEKPRHAVELGRFAIMRHEVTVREYAACVQAGACSKPRSGRKCTWKARGKDDHPVTCVTWKAADAYCKHRGWRLPTEAEWEVAARGSESRAFPWGDEPASCERAVIANQHKGGCGAGGPKPVGSQPVDRSWAGVFDLGGNVREWTASEYGAYPGGRTDASRRGRVSRGASWSMKADQADASYNRGVDDPTAARPDLGFRCAVGL